MFDIEIQLKGEIVFILKVQLRRIESRYKDTRKAVHLVAFLRPEPQDEAPQTYVCTFILYNGQLTFDCLSSSFPFLLSSFPFLLTSFLTLLSGFATEILNDQVKLVLLMETLIKV